MTKIDLFRIHTAVRQTRPVHRARPRQSLSLSLPTTTATQLVAPFQASTNTYGVLQ